MTGSELVACEPLRLNPYALDPALPFDGPSFLRTLDHIGNYVPGEYPLLERRIDGTRFWDAIGTLPYSERLTRSCPDALRDFLLRKGYVSFVFFTKPGEVLDTDLWRHAGFRVALLKQHFLHAPFGTPITFSARSRRNLRLGARQWTIRNVESIDAWRLLAAWHEEALRCRQVNPLTRYPAGHFLRLAGVEGFRCKGAFDHEGLGAILAAAETEDALHLYAVGGESRAYRTAGFYRLFEYAVEEWGAGRTVYLGGVPGTGAEGVGKFKQRFANRTAEAMMVQILLRPDVCEELVAARGRHAWFPPYRSPFEEQ